MSALIEALKKEHSEIVAVLNEVKELGILSQEGLAKFLSLRVRLFAHLQKEGEQIYPVLRKEAESDKRLKNTLDLIEKDMENVSRIAIDFFDKYSGGVLGTEFREDFDSFFSVLILRISSEEDILYEMYEKINQ